MQLEYSAYEDQEVYGEQSVTETIIAMRKDEQTGGHARLR